MEDKFTIQSISKQFSIPIQDLSNLCTFFANAPAEGFPEAAVISTEFRANPSVIAISNQKGGEGKTTLSLFLSEALSESCKVLLVDWDSQANATRVLLEEEPEDTIFHCLPYRGNQPVAVTRIIQKVTPGFHVLPSSIALANFTTPFGFEDFMHLKDLLHSLKHFYDYVIIDCPPSLGLGLENALIASDYVLVPIQTRIFSVQGLGDLHETIDKIKKKANPGLKLMGAVLNQYEEARALSGLSEGIRKYFPVFKTSIPRRESIPQSQAKRKMLSGCDVISKKAFFALAKEIQEFIYDKKK
jgi:chromosome partitioning protein